MERREIEKSLQEIENQKEKILEAIKNRIQNENINNIKVWFNRFVQPHIGIAIQPKSAWSEVIELYIYENKEILKTSNAWEKEENAFKEVLSILNTLKDIVENFDRTVIDKLIELEEQEDILLDVLKKIEIEQDNERVLEGKILVTDVKKLLEDIKKENRELTIYLARENLPVKKMLLKFENRYKITDTYCGYRMISKKDLLDLFTKKDVKIYIEKGL